MLAKKEAQKSRLSFQVLRDMESLPAVVNLAKEAHEEIRFSYIEFSEEKVHKIAVRAFSGPKRHGVMLAYKGIAPVGFSFCTIGEYHVGTGALVATIQSICVSRRIGSALSGGYVALGLFKGIESWSRNRGAHEVLLHIASGIDVARGHKLAKKLGYQFIGGSYAKRFT